MRMKLTTTCCLLSAFVLTLGTSSAVMAQEASMLSGNKTDDGKWRVSSIFTIGNDVDGYVPPGIPDGQGAFELNRKTVRVLVNHELRDGQGYPYSLGNGTELTGARVSYFDIDKRSRKVVGAGLAYDTIVDRYGEVVTSATQINEGDDPTAGIHRLCSANYFAAGTFGLEDAIFFTGEETGGGQEYALDPYSGTLYTAPWLGRAAWESVTMVETGDPNTVAVVVGDDRAPAPLLLYVGVKNAVGDGSFLDRNGLAYGTLYAWVADDGSTTPFDFFGTGNSKSGTFVEIPHYDASLAGTDGYDDQGFADQDTQDALVAAAGGFLFSRPEDVDTNPDNPYQAVMASTGRGSLYDVDDWGTTYIMDFSFGESITADLHIVYDGDDAGNGQFPDPDFGLRSPDNLAWAKNGMIYLQEDRSTSNATFGGVSEAEASVWELDPYSGKLNRIATMDRSAVPDGQVDGDPDDLGDWESSGVIDVTDLFKTRGGSTLLLANVQAHSIDLGSEDLVQGGQLVFIEGKKRRRHAGGRHNGMSKADEDGSAVQFVLKSAYPNPFNPQTTITYTATSQAQVSLSVFDVTGRHVKTLFDGVAEAGVHTVNFDASGLSSGVYLVRMQSPAGVQTQRLLLMK